MTPPLPDHFEMRRLESLSNTIFGVAMTLLAYSLPQAAHFEQAPGWADLYHAFGGRLLGMVLSFIIAGVFWFSHQRRLARQPVGSRGAVMLNLLFLLSIILLPVTNGLYGNYGMSGAVAVLYGLHLTVIASLNAILWRLATGPGLHPELAAAVFPLLLFVPGTVVAAIEPKYAIYLWLAAFSGLWVRRLLRSRDDAAPQL
jgi:TMEM175 potassium channel family protein